MSWDADLVAAMYSKIAEATRAAGANIAFAPVINLFMDPRYGALRAVPSLHRSTHDAHAF